MKLKIVLYSIVVLTALFLSAFGSPAARETINLQATATAVAQNTVEPQTTVAAPNITGVPPTVVVVPGTPVAVPVTGGDAATGIWTLVLFGLLALLGIAFLVALFSPRTTAENIDRNPPPPDV
jgi:hypothetical protein